VATSADPLGEDAGPDLADAGVDTDDDVREDAGSEEDIGESVPDQDDLGEQEDVPNDQAEETEAVEDPLPDIDSILNVATLSWESAGKLQVRTFVRTGAFDDGELEAHRATYRESELERFTFDDGWCVAIQFDITTPEGGRPSQSIESIYNQALGPDIAVSLNGGEFEPIEATETEVEGRPHFEYPNSTELEIDGLTSTGFRIGDEEVGPINAPQDLPAEIDLLGDLDSGLTMSWDASDYDFVEIGLSAVHNGHDEETGLDFHRGRDIKCHYFGDFTLDFGADSLGFMKDYMSATPEAEFRAWMIVGNGDLTLYGYHMVENEAQTSYSVIRNIAVNDVVD